MCSVQSLIYWVQFAGTSKQEGSETGSSNYKLQRTTDAVSGSSDHWGTNPSGGRIAGNGGNDDESRFARDLVCWSRRIWASGHTSLRHTGSASVTGNARGIGRARNHLSGSGGRVCRNRDFLSVSRRAGALWHTSLRHARGARCARNARKRRSVDRDRHLLGRAGRRNLVGRSRRRRDLRAGTSRRNDLGARTSRTLMLTSIRKTRHARVARNTGSLGRTRRRGDLGSRARRRGGLRGRSSRALELTSLRQARCARVARNARRLSGGRDFIGTSNRAYGGAQGNGLCDSSGCATTGAIGNIRRA